ncbi:MAG: ribbon-helix-helix protein, CopG family [Acidithiobacillus ferrooxidans]|nr:ribbon-helix-helix protein, CopG family [Acidithiobacillus ferrooxidans]MDD5004618.1 ribbon-helix-helix protein, CopG family [Acidithiobacillus sp.]MDD5378733.1 ribbon-helix-helix protein, CopG family [Acidithiobacillus sp.]
MSTLTIRLPDDKAERIKAMARMKGISVNKLFEEWSAQMLTEMDVERRFQIMAARGDIQAALDILNRIDQAYSAG